MSEFGYIQDIASIAFSPNLISPSALTSSNSEIRGSSDYALSFTTDSLGIKAGRVITIDFPDRYGAFFIGQAAPKITVAKSGDATTVSYTPIKRGNGLQFTLTSALAASSKYVFSIASFDNPEDVVCNMDVPMITVTTSDRL